MKTPNYSHSETYEELFVNLNNITKYLQINSNYHLIQEGFEYLASFENGQNNGINNRAFGIVAIAADEMGLDLYSIVGSILQFIPNKIELENKLVLSKYGDDIFNIANKLQQIALIRMDKISIMPENFIQLLLRISDDIRVILILLADRIYSMRNIESFSLEKQRQISLETSALYAPLAHRLGLYKIIG